LIPGFDGASFTSKWKDALWDKYLRDDARTRRACLMRLRNAASELTKGDSDSPAVPAFQNQAGAPVRHQFGRAAVATGDGRLPQYIASATAMPKSSKSRPPFNAICGCSKMSHSHRPQTCTDPACAEAGSLSLER